MNLGEGAKIFGPETLRVARLPSAPRAVCVSRACKIARACEAQCVVRLVCIARLLCAPRALPPQLPWLGNQVFALQLTNSNFALVFCENELSSMVYIGSKISHKNQI